jgi:hypothetical protein
VNQKSVDFIIVTALEEERDAARAVFPELQENWENWAGALLFYFYARYKE